MKLLITGANGFLGRYVVAEAVKQGINVRALLRPASKNIPESWKNHCLIEIVYGDLRKKDKITELFSDCDVVVHLAATKTGDIYEQLSGTVIATENLLNAMKEANLSKIVLISSFAVYEYKKRLSFSVLDESSPLAVDTFKRDQYCQTKTLQEKLVLQIAKENSWQCVVLRPGVIFGRDNLWTARLGMQLNPKKWLTIGNLAALPLTYVENCASAIVLASEFKGADKTKILNIVDGKPPSQAKYIRFLKKHTPGKVKIVFIPWLIMRFIAFCASSFNRLFLHGNGKIPGLFVPESQHARFKPLKYSNKLIIDSLDWYPRFTWKEGIERSLSVMDLTSVSPIEVETV